MADLSLKIKSDFAQAEADFQSLAATSDAARAKIENFSKSFSAEQIDKFTDKNKLAAIAAEATGGKLAGMSREAAGLKSEIERLIKNGMSPQDEKMKVLVADYNRLQGEIAQTNTEAKKQNGIFGESIKKIGGMIAAYVSFQAVTGIIKAVTFDLSTQGDELAKTSRRLGITAEAYQELTYAADMSGVSAETLTTSLEYMSKAVGQAQAGTGRLKSYLEKTNPALLAQVKAAQNSEEAFNLLAAAASDIKNPMEAAAFATAAFGGSGQEMLQLTSEGADGIAFLREEAQRYGNVMSTEVAEAAERFNDAQANVMQVVKGLALAIGGELLAPMADAMQGFAEWASSGDNLKNTLSNIAIVLTTSGIAMAAYAVATGIATGAITASSVALKLQAAAQWLVNAAMSANPVGLLVAGLVILIGVLVLVVKNWDVVKVALVNGFEYVKAVGVQAWEYLKLTFFTVVKAIVQGVQFIYSPFIALVNTIIMGINKVTGKSIPTLTDGFKAMTSGLDKAISGSQAKIAEMDAKRASSAAKAAAATKSSVDSIKKSVSDKVQNSKKGTDAVVADHEREKASARSTADTYKQVLESIAMTELQKHNQMLNESASFFEQRATLESEDFAARIEYLQAQYAALAELDKMSKEERLAAEAGLTEAIRKQQQLQTEMYFKFAQSTLSQTRSLFEDLATVMNNAGKSGRKFAVAAKAIAIAEAAISAHLAAARSLAEFPLPFNLIAAGISYAAGAARVAAIASTPIPSAQTGGEFKVPDTPATRNDKAVVMASGGETVSVNQRGESGNKQTVVNVQFDKFKIFQVVQEGVDTGQINVSDRNIGVAVFA